MEAERPVREGEVDRAPSFTELIITRTFFPVVYFRSLATVCPLLNRSSQFFPLIYSLIHSHLLSGRNISD